MLMHNKNTYKNSQIHKFGMNKTFRKPSAEPSLLELCRGKGKSSTFRKPSAEPSLLELCRGEGKSLKVFIMSSLFVFLSKREFLEVTFILFLT